MCDISQSARLRINGKIFSWWTNNLTRGCAASCWVSAISPRRKAALELTGCKIWTMNFISQLSQGKIIKEKECIWFLSKSSRSITYILINIQQQTIYKHRLFAKHYNFSYDTTNHKKNIKQIFKINMKQTCETAVKQIMKCETNIKLFPLPVLCSCPSFVFLTWTPHLFSIFFSTLLGFLSN